MSDKFDRRSITNTEQVRLLCSPVRQEIVDTLNVLGGEADVATLAEQLGRPADGLYYHLRTLLAGGLIIQTMTEDGSERRYRLAGDGAGPFRLAYDLGPKGNALELRSFVHGLLHIAGRDFENSLTNTQVVVEGTGRELWASRNKGWLSENDLAEVNALLERLSILTSQAKNDDRKYLVSLAFVMAPISAQPKRREQRKGAPTAKEKSR